MAKTILNLTEHFQFRPCHFSFYHVFNFRFELRVGIFCYFLKKMVSEIKRPPLWRDMYPPLRYMYIIVQCGLSSIVE